jgi:hypothetical protein
MEWLQNNWVQVVAGYLLFIKVITTIRDAVDTTPGVDVNWFERTVTIMEKLGASLLTGKRAK